MTDAMALFVTAVLPCSLGILAILVAEALERKRLFDELMDYLLDAQLLMIDLRKVEQVIALNLESRKA